MNNSEAVGYAIVALNNLFDNSESHAVFPEKKREFIKDFVSEMYYQFDMKTESEAETIGSIISTSDSETELRQRLHEYYQKEPDKIITVDYDKKRRHDIKAVKSKDDTKPQD